MTTASSLLLDTARRGELHHAIILYGPSPALLRELAGGIAKTINCLNGSTGDACLACDRIERRIHPDVHFIEVGGERKLISVEQIREILSASVMRPFEGRGKVFIIDPADALSVSGSNSLLKTLEEPTSDTTFILITRSPGSFVTTTVRPRARRCSATHCCCVVLPEPSIPSNVMNNDVILSRTGGEGSSVMPAPKILRFAQDDTAARPSRNPLR